MQVLLRTPVEQDFERFLNYSRRVREISPYHSYSQDLLSGDFIQAESRYSLGCHCHIPSSVWDILSAFGPKPLLPNLQSILHREWLPYTHMYPRTVPLQPADLLFGPKLKIATIDCLDSSIYPERATEVVRAMSSVVSSLEHLSIKAEPEPYSSMTTTGSLYGPEVLLLSRLTKFVGRSVRVAPDALVALGQLPSLEVMFLHVDPVAYAWDSLPRDRCTYLFPALQQLTLHEIDFVWCTTFLRTLSSTSLRTLSFRSEHYPLPPPMVFEALCVAITKLPSADSIIDLFFIISITRGDLDHNLSNREYEIYWSEDIAPLLTLPAVQRLVFKGRCTTLLDDRALETMAQNWPDLVELVLTWAWNAPPRPDDARLPEDDDFPYVTSWGLLYLAQHCPRLTKLALAVDLRFEPPPRNVAVDYGLAPIPPVHLSGDAVPALASFDATGSLLGDRVGVASFLSLLFPRLSELTDNHVAAQGWVEVKNLHSGLVRVRSQERTWAQRHGWRLREPDLSIGPQTGT